MAAVRSRDIAYLIVVSGPGRDAFSQSAYLSVDMLRKAGASQVEAQEAYATLRRGLAIARERDAVVDWRDSIEVYRTSFARSGNRDLTIKTFPKADHEMLSPPEGSASSTYVPGYIDAMIEWLAARNLTSRSDN